MQAEKTILIKDLLDRVNASPFLLVADYNGLTVAQFSELRKRLREAGSKMHVSKNTYIKKVLKEANLPDGLSACLVGQTAIVTGDKEVTAAAKILKTFASEFSRPKLKMGSLDGRLLSAAQVQALADLPSREVIFSQLLGLLQTPAINLVRLINEPGARTARVVKAWADKGNA